MPDLTLAAFNSHYGLCAPPHPPRTPYDVPAAIRRLAADIIVIEELWRPDGVHGIVDDVAAELGLDLVYEQTGRATAIKRWPHITPRGEGSVGIAVLSALPMRRVGAIRLGPTPGDPAPNRTALHVEVTVEGEPLQVIAVHLTSRLPFGPPLQLRRLAGAIPEDGAAVVAGDCNFWGFGVRAFMRRWKRAVRGRTWPARHPHSQIDHVLVRPWMHVRASEVLPDLGSDHRPVRAAIGW